MNRTANWKLRCGSALKNAVELIRPALVLLLPGTPTSESGLPRLTWLKRLTASMRNSIDLASREPEVLEERRVHPPVSGPAQRVPLHVAERSARRPRKGAPRRADRRRVEPLVARLRAIGIADQIRPVVAARIAVGSRVPVVDAEREPALDDRVRVELPAADERIREQETGTTGTVGRARPAARPRATGRSCACGPNRLVPCSSRRRRRSSPRSPGPAAASV